MPASMGIMSASHFWLVFKEEAFRIFDRYESIKQEYKEILEKPVVSIGRFMWDRSFCPTYGIGE